MLTQVEVRNGNGDVLILPLQDVSSGLIVSEVDGLDPVKATLVSSSFATLDGEQYHTSRREARNLKLTLDLMPYYVLDTVQTLRKRLYSYFMPKSLVNLRFIDSVNPPVEIYGRVESLETPLFSQNPSVEISLMCYDPDFVDVTSTVMSLSTTNTSTENVIEYDGTVEAGILFTLNVDRAISALTLYHRPPDGSVRTLDFAGSLAAGDVLKISTVPGSKGATLIHTGTETSVLYGVSPQSNWIEIQPGTNYFRAYVTGAAIPYTLEYSNRYGGL